MVESLGAYHWSIYHRASVLAKSVSCRAPHPVCLVLGKTLLERVTVHGGLSRGQYDEEVLKDIRNLSSQGMGLRREYFKTESEGLSGRRAMCLKRGPKRKGELETFLI